MESTRWNLHDGIYTMEYTRWNPHDGIWNLHNGSYTMESTQWNPHNAIISITHFFRRIRTSHFLASSLHWSIISFSIAFGHLISTLRQTLCTTDFLRSITKNAFRSGSSGCTSRGDTSKDAPKPATASTVQPECFASGVGKIAVLKTALRNPCC